MNETHDQIVEYPPHSKRFTMKYRIISAPTNIEMEEKLNEFAEAGWMICSALAGSAHNNPWLRLWKDEQVTGITPILPEKKKTTSASASSSGEDIYQEVVSIIMQQWRNGSLGNEIRAEILRGR